MTRWPDVFDTFAAARLAAAIKAALPPYVTEFRDPGHHAWAVGNAWSSARFDGPFYVTPEPEPDRPACSLVFVQSADGNTGAADPGTLGGGSTDKHLIYEGLSRVACDAVLAGANTVRGANVLFSVWHPEMIQLRADLGLPRHPVQIVATQSGLALEEMLLFNVPDVSVVLLASTRAMRRMEEALRRRPWISTIVLESARDLPSAFAQLRSRGIDRVSCIGGRTLARALLDASLVDDVYLTTSPRRGGEPHTPLHVSPWRGPVVLRKHGTGAEEGVVFEHIVPLRA